jgi:glycosyltransferase involved in cell wall biosynthesis
MPPLSAVLITRNEAGIIRPTLEAIAWCDEIIIVDSGSTDDTLAICAEYGAKCFTHVFQGFGPQKQYAVSLATNDWVLCLDADEVLSKKLQEDIQKVMQNPMADGYRLRRTLVFMDTVFKYGRESREYHLRLFNRAKGNFNDATVHEKVVLNGSIQNIHSVIMHYSYTSIEQYFNKFNEYTTAGARQLAVKGKHRSFLLLALSLPFNFCKHYIIYGNFRNGSAGWVWSLFSSFYPIVKYIKATSYTKTS